MSSDTRHDDLPIDEPERDLRPGPFAWCAILLGWAVMVVAVLGASNDGKLGGFTSWATWLVGAALVHDLLVLPIVLATGWLLTRLLPRPWRTPLRIALVVAAVTALTVWPIARRWGARDDNPSILPLPVMRNLAILVAVVLLIGLIAGVVAGRNGNRPGTNEAEDLS